MTRTDKLQRPDHGLPGSKNIGEEWEGGGGRREMKTLHPKGFGGKGGALPGKEKRGVMEIWRSHGKGWGDHKHNSC